MGAIKDLWQSERGLLMVALVAAATTLTALGIITPAQWLNYSQWLFVTYVTGKTVTGAVAIAKAAPSPSASSDAVSVLLDFLSKLSPRPAPAAADATPTPTPVVPTAATPPKET